MAMPSNFRLPELNSVILSGKVMGGLQEREVGETRLTQFDLGMSKYAGKGEDGRGKYKNVYVKVKCWGKLADAMRSLNKYDPVIVQGVLEMEEWLNNDGKRRQRLFVTATQIHCMTWPEMPGTGGYRHGSMETGGGVTEEDIPF